ncbi:MAG: hypothetical protein H7240_11285 [Glaciimonas sp.]|nr:hypothetical protein [Glaciimonas sp.]
MVGSTGAGAKSVFAIDVTDPTNLDAESILLEIVASGDFADMGNIMGCGI